MCLYESGSNYHYYTRARRMSSVMTMVMKISLRGLNATDSDKLNSNLHS